MRSSPRRLALLAAAALAAGALLFYFGGAGEPGGPERDGSTEASASAVAPGAPGGAEDPRRAGNESAYRVTRNFKPASIAGRVIDAAGGPTAGAVVSARAGPLVQITTAGPDGAFLVEELFAGEYTLYASLGVRASEPLGPVPVNEGEELRELTLVLQMGAAVSGVVRDARDGSPIPGAAVGGGGASGGTDERGRYRLVGLSPGVTELYASAPGYQARTSEVELVAGKERGGADLHLERAAKVHGRVEAQGRPVRHVHVLATRYGFANATPSALELIGTTDPDGKFEGDAPTGRIQLVGRADGYAESRSDPLELAPGEEREVNLTLGPGGSIFGQVRDAQGAGVGGCSLEAFDAVHGRGVGRGASGPVGQYWIAGVPHAVYRVVASCAQGYAEAAGVQVAEGDQVQVDLQLGSASIGGRVVDANGGPIGGAQIDVRLDGSPSAGAPASFTGPDGAFRVHGLAGARFAVVATAPQGTAERTGVAAGTTDLVLTIASGELLGQVVGDHGEGVPDFTVYAEPLDFGAGRPRSQRFVSPNGDFRLPLTPGRYALKAGAPGYSAGKVPSVDVRPGGGGSRVRIVLTRGSTVRGRVLDAAGAGVPGAQVATHPNLLWAFGRVAPVPNGVVTTSGPDGSFTLNGVAPGERVHLFAHRDGYRQPKPVFVSVPPDGQVDGVEIRLDPGRTEGTDEFAGVGMTLGAEEGQVGVMEVFEGGPARQAGVRPGDRILAVDGVPVSGAKLNEAIAMIRGPVGTTVQLSVRRANRDFAVAMPRVPVKF